MPKTMHSKPAQEKVVGVYPQPPKETVDPVTKKKMVTYTLSIDFNTENTSAHVVRLTATPSQELDFMQGAVPALEGGQGIVYKILYKTDPRSAYSVLAENIPADAPYQFDRPEGASLIEIVLLFENVYAGFANDAKVEYTFHALGAVHSNPYTTTWTRLSQTPAIDSRTLTAKTVRLEELIASATDPARQAELKAILGYVQAVINDPNATDDQVADALAALDAAIGAETVTNSANGLPLRQILTIGSAVLGLISLFLFFFLLFAKRRKKKKT